MANEKNKTMPTGKYSQGNIQSERGMGTDARITIMGKTEDEKLKPSSQLS